MTLQLNAKIREFLGKKVVQVRQAGKVPAVVYGHNQKNLNLEVDYVEFEKILQKAGESTLLNITVEGQEPIKAIIADVQYETIKNRISHVDFHQVNMKEKIHANVTLDFVGESKLVKEDGAMIIHNISEVEVKCLPGDLIHEIKVDISGLNTFDNVIAVKNLIIPKGIEIVHHDPEDIVVSVAEPREEKEEIPVEAAATEPAAEEAKKEEPAK